MEMPVYCCPVKAIWGGHHYNFNAHIQQLPPVLEEPLEDFISRYDIKAITLDTDYIKIDKLPISNGIHRVESQNCQ